jgi:SAM-dependent methyltransferase
MQASRLHRRLMANQNPKAFAAPPALYGSLDLPAPGESIYDQAIFLSGWVHAPDRDPTSCRLQAYLDDACVAETRNLFHRPDICEKFGLSSSVLNGFRMLGRILPAATEERGATLRIVASWSEGPSSVVTENRVRLVPALLHERPHGQVVSPENVTLLHRKDIYGSGPPLENPAIEVANLLRNYLPERASVLDVGCGTGAYGPGLIVAGYRWLGLEANAHCCDILLRQELPFRRVELESRNLPCADREWDCAICLEVLEHVKEPEIFVHEIARAIRRRALFSVPNMEVLPYLHGWGVVPWHLLEADHKNFFTRASLRTLLQSCFRHVEVFPYGVHPLRTREGVAVYVHLFAVAEK